MGSAERQQRKLSLQVLLPRQAVLPSHSLTVFAHQLSKLSSIRRNILIDPEQVAWVVAALASAGEKRDSDQGRWGAELTHSTSRSSTSAEKNLTPGPIPPAGEERDSGQRTMGWPQACRHRQRKIPAPGPIPPIPPDSPMQRDFGRRTRRSWHACGAPSGIRWINGAVNFPRKERRDRPGTGRCRGPDAAPTADRVHLDHPVDEASPALDQLGGAHPHSHGGNIADATQHLQGRGRPSLGTGQPSPTPKHRWIECRGGRILPQVCSST